MHDIARFIISYKTRIVWAVFRCHRMTISLIDFFSAQKMWDPKNENARKLLAFKHLKNKKKCFRPNNVFFSFIYHILSKYTSNKSDLPHFNELLRILQPKN